MAKLTRAALREIIPDFAKIIVEQRTLGSKPAKAVIDFRNDKKVGRERDVWEVPIELLRFRKENGRISSDVISYERVHGVLDEAQDSTQQILRKFLEDRDEEKTKELKPSITHEEQ